MSFVASTNGCPTRIMYGCRTSIMVDIFCIQLSFRQQKGFAGASMINIVAVDAWVEERP